MSGDDDSGRQACHEAIVDNFALLYNRFLPPVHPMEARAGIGGIRAIDNGQTTTITLNVANVKGGNAEEGIRDISACLEAAGFEPEITNQERKFATHSVTAPELRVTIPNTTDEVARMHKAMIDGAKKSVMRKLQEVISTERHKLRDLEADDVDAVVSGALRGAMAEQSPAAGKA